MSELLTRLLDRVDRWLTPPHFHLSINADQAVDLDEFEALVLRLHGIACALARVRDLDLGDVRLTYDKPTSYATYSVSLSPPDLNLNERQAESVRGFVEDELRSVSGLGVTVTLVRHRECTPELAVKS
jgi:hypothetical protein